MTREVIAATIAAVCLAGNALAQATGQQGQQGPATCASQGAPALPSTEILDDGRVTFRLCAPDATTVAVASPDHAALRSVAPGGEGMVMERDESGRWVGTTTTPVPPGTYRFRFLVNGVRTPDPMGTLYSEERTAVNSLLVVPGAAGGLQDYDRTVAHGTISEVEYWSESLGVLRRAHVYTPPGYMKDSNSYPVLYLVHGAGDNDDSWSTIGRMNYILDNLIARGEAVPMIVVMPFGHTPDRPGATGGTLNNPDFGADLLNDLIPHIEANFRTLDGPENRAMAGLSMGGAHTIRNGLTHPELFSYIGIFSMGLNAGNEVAAFKAEHDAALRRAANELRLVYFAMGETDFLYSRVAPTRALFDEYGIDHIYNETSGGHTWINWRDYLADFVPRLFR
ncbi:MAG TPA: alpha/beta fold hydrolase [Longimicrobiales bacterium]|nr:alpha/beta fold hydrolase [Longimicrobiales bacterium]